MAAYAAGAVLGGMVMLKFRRFQFDDVGTRLGRGPANRNMGRSLKGGGETRALLLRREQERGE
jgi:hypothetical protein